MSFLNDYLEYNECNESHTNFHVWSSLVTLASAVGRRVWIDYGHQWIYPHIYVTLVGPPGIRKSTAMHIAKKMMREVGEIPFGAQLESSEGLIKQMSETEVGYEYNGEAKTFMPMTICVGELKDFLGVSMQKMINFVTAVWDQDYYDYKTRNKEDITIVNPYLCILACDTPAWITSRLRDDVISGGYSRRNLFVLETTKAREIPRPKVTPNQVLAWDRCVAHAQRSRAVAGPFKWTSDAEKTFDEIYYYKATGVDLNTQGWFESRHVMVLKTAMLLARSEDPHALMMEPKYLLAAHDLLKSVEVKMPKVFEGLGRNVLTQASSKMLEVLRLHGGPIKEKQLRAIMWNDAQGREFDEILSHLSNAKRVIGWTTGQGGQGPKFLCLRELVPAEVAQLLSRAEATEQGSSLLNGQSSQLETDLSSLLRPPPAVEPPAPTASSEGSVAPPVEPFRNPGMS